MKIYYAEKADFLIMVTYFIFNGEKLPPAPAGHCWEMWSNGFTALEGTPVEASPEDLLQQMKDRPNNKQAEYSGLVVVKNKEIFSLVKKY